MEKVDQRAKIFSAKSGERHGKKRLVCYIPVNLAIQVKEYSWQKRQTITDYVIESLLEQIKKDRENAQSEALRGVPW